MNGKSQFHHNQTYSVFYGTSHCVKVRKDLVESYLKYHPET
jgi:hypothetical protein